MTSPTDAVDPGPGPVEQRLGGLTAVLLGTLRERSVEVAHQVRERIDFYRESGVVTLDDLAASCEENLRFVIDGLARGVVGDPAPAAATGVRRAEAGVPLPAVLAAYRVGFRTMWEHVADECARRGIPAELVVGAAADAVVANDVFTEAMSAAYNATLTAQLVRREAERTALVEALLSGTVVDRRTLWEVADLLGLPVAGTYVVAAAVLPAPGRSALVGVETELARVGCRSTWRLLPDVQVGIIDAGTVHVERVVEVLEAEGRARVGVSPVFEDLTGAARALELARLSAAAAPAAGGVLRFGDDPVGIAVAASGDVFGRVADDVLGPLDSLAEAERYTLLETLEVWVEVGGSATKTATRLSCHANTVRHRLRRFEEKTGRRLDRPRDVAALCLALEARRD
ncbi:PucR family transcriptional regulator [Nocardioides jiangxiensis]|uniref:Helix-turn-helix domain-containing protein n=1 Tax=Nocardioides jiangxiensis TaxID=3064524 RepID=A0ABT9B528_9ACTN|nr:helix-turn-helix domain-containing protein [Nocardioides sp. WY-20]MDO7868233.1 helix-turn-helix domain-containing protein [Nocardioides sp. WY-20]